MLNLNTINMVALAELFGSVGLNDNNSYKWCIAGGFCRDIRVGLEPKDADVLVVGVKGDVEAFELAKRISDIVSRYGLGSSEVYHAYGQTATSMASSDDFAERHYCCIKVQLVDSIPIDILIEKADTLREAIDNFDCNLNQYAWTPMIKMHRPYYFGRNPENELHFLKPVRQSRIDKMTKFYREYISNVSN